MTALVGGIAAMAYAVTSAEPTDPGAVTLVLFGVGAVAFAVSGAAHRYFELRLGRGRRARSGASLRRGALIGAGVATIAFLRVVDALSAVTVVFVIAALAALEGVLSARR